MPGTPVLIFAFDPIEELGGRAGVLAVEPALAETILAERRAERIEDHATLSMRYISGSPEHAAARDALRAARAELIAEASPPAPRRGRPPRER